MATDQDLSRCYRAGGRDSHPVAFWTVYTANGDVRFCDFCLRDLLADMLLWGGSSVRGIRLV